MSVSLLFPCFRRRRKPPIRVPYGRPSPEAAPIPPATARDLLTALRQARYQIEALQRTVDALEQCVQDTIALTREDHT